MNRFEQMKRERDGLDILESIPRFAEEGFESIADEDLDRLKWAGIFHRKPTKPFFMMRLRFPGGVASSKQIFAVGDLLDRYGRGVADLTTRQQIEPRWLRVEDMPQILRDLDVAGITSLQTGMDNIRGIVSCPLSGLYPNELLDASSVCREFQSMFIGNRAFTNLPRKFNVAITGCPDNCIEAESQDVALVPATCRVGATELLGFNVLVGGKMGSGGFTVAQPLDVFVEPRQAAVICREIALVFRDHGPREARSHARLAFLIEERGIEWLRTEVQRRLDWALHRAGDDARSSARIDHIGVTHQLEPGLNAVGLLVPVGRVTSAQLREAARLADEYGRGNLRLTPGQNLILTHVPEQRVPALLAEPLLREWMPDPTPAMRGTVACTGTDFCNLALIDTKARALEVAEFIGSPASAPLTIRWSGCPAGCGNHHSADIGLQGKRIRRDGRVIEAVTIYAGGRAGPDAKAGQVVMEDVPCDEHLPAVIEALILSVRCKSPAGSGPLVAVEPQAIDPVDRPEVPVSTSALSLAR